MPTKPVPRRQTRAEDTLRREHASSSGGLCRVCSTDWPCATIQVCNRVGVLEERESRRFGTDVPPEVRRRLIENREAVSLAEACFQEWRTRFVLENQDAITLRGGIDLDVAVMSAFTTAWDQALEAAAALADTEDAAKMTWRLWCEGMLAQRRQVAFERMDWTTLSEEDRALDQTISRGMGAYLIGLLAR
jgi:hypothetical protein